jgi:hypothetical protein
MTDQPCATKDGVCRRSLLKSVPMIAGTFISATAIPGRLFAQTKISHEIAKYQDQPNNGQQCATLAFNSSHHLPARQWRAQSARTGGANSMSPSRHDLRPS